MISLMKNCLQIKPIEQKIYLLRGKKVLVDRDLAELYGVETKYLTRQVRRNIERFPGDFMFQLTKEEFQRCQIGTFGTSQKGSRKYLPIVFTEQGIAMLSGVLHSKRAIAVNIEIMRAFVRLREMIRSYHKLWKKLCAMEKKYEGQFKVVFEAIRGLMVVSEKPKPLIGFHPK